MNHIGGFGGASQYSLTLQTPTASLIAPICYNVFQCIIIIVSICYKMFVIMFAYVKPFYYCLCYLFTYFYFIFFLFVSWEYIKSESIRTEKNLSTKICPLIYFIFHFVLLFFGNLSKGGGVGIFKDFPFFAYGNGVWTRLWGLNLRI